MTGGKERKLVIKVRKINGNIFVFTFFLRNPSIYQLFTKRNSFLFNREAKLNVLDVSSSSFSP